MEVQEAVYRFKLRLNMDVPIDNTALLCILQLS